MTKVTDAMQAVTQLGYDANSNVTSLTDARNGVTGFGYDGMDQRVTRTDALTKGESYASGDG